MVVFCCGVIDKTEMYEAARQKCSRECFLWVLYAGRRSQDLIGVLLRLLDVLFKVMDCLLTAI